MLKKIGAFTGAAALAVGLMTVAAAPASAKADPCGGFGVFSLYYNHCGPAEKIWIRVDQVDMGGYQDFDKCVGRGTTEIGPRFQYIKAWYLRDAKPGEC
ncbi:DUF6355 family natural product biosynthesis protein [Allokutzneria sp. NRRL B-24872]|uniref:DUF6355 family natural product biosynthesis protein n=1 Tax=Allokutzneria sp. NRRL B-24872 TaxID=1137961 RepID=UPI000A385538|nr:DUF6355 family natural product biosynthesis protein [Allokutzneria sp. NRRL B-24872]